MAVYQYDLIIRKITQAMKLTNIQVLVWNYVKVDTNRQVEIEGRLRWYFEVTDQCETFFSTKDWSIFYLYTVIVEVRKVFEIFDEDHDGKITTKELGGSKNWLWAQFLTVSTHHELLVSNDVS